MDLSVLPSFNEREKERKKGLREKRIALTVYCKTNRKRERERERERERNEVTKNGKIMKYGKKMASQTFQCILNIFEKRLSLRYRR